MFKLNLDNRGALESKGRNLGGVVNSRWRSPRIRGWSMQRELMYSVPSRANVARPCQQ